MSDSSVHYFCLVLCTDSFYVPDVIRLMNTLCIRYGLNPYIHCKKVSTGVGPRIYIPAGDMSTLRSIVLPYMHPPMLYKWYNILVYYTITFMILYFWLQDIIVLWVGLGVILIVM